MPRTSDEYDDRISSRGLHDVLRRRNRDATKLDAGRRVELAGRQRRADALGVRQAAKCFHPSFAWKSQRIARDINAMDVIDGYSHVVRARRER